jgi:ArsR family transcriptional regulator
MQDMTKNCIDQTEIIKKVREYLPKRQDVIELERVFSTLADKTRIRIVSALSITPMKVGELCDVLKINQTTLSHQLAFLRSYGVVCDERIGKNVTYSIKNRSILSLFSCALDFIEEDNAKIDAYAIDF